MKQTYGGAPVGTGAIYGEGCMILAVHLFLDMDAMIGGNFEKGLAHMKSVVEIGRDA
jgi:hypothetical protein